MIEENPIRVSFKTTGNGIRILLITMPRPSNFHAHLRSGSMMRAVAPGMMQWVKYLLSMPNSGPIDTVEKVRAYRKECQMIADECGYDTTMVSTIYLTAQLTPRVVEEIAALPFPCGVKYYPPVQGATTGSGLGVPLGQMSETLRAMQSCGVRLLGHFESVHDLRGRELPMEEREGYFMDHEFPRLRYTYPELLINIEHATTRKAVERVKEDPSGRTACGITPQAMLFVSDDLTRRTWGNHLRCMPIAKPPEDRDAVLEFATSGDFRAHLGDDTAPHLSRNKQGPLDGAACGCYLPHSLALYAKAFQSKEALDHRFVKFACLNGPDWWGLPRPDPHDQVNLIGTVGSDDIPDPTPVPAENDVVIPLGWTEEKDRMKIGIKLDQS